MHSKHINRNTRKVESQVLSRRLRVLHPSIYQSPLFVCLIFTFHYTSLHSMPDKTISISHRVSDWDKFEWGMFRCLFLKSPSLSVCVKAKLLSQLNNSSRETEREKESNTCTLSPPLTFSLPFSSFDLAIVLLSSFLVSSSYSLTVNFFALNALLYT